LKAAIRAAKALGFFAGGGGVDLAGVGLGEVIEAEEGVVSEMVAGEVG